MLGIPTVSGSRSQAVPLQNSDGHPHSLPAPSPGTSGADLGVLESGGLMRLEAGERRRSTGIPSKACQFSTRTGWGPKGFSSIAPAAWLVRDDRARCRAPTFYILLYGVGLQHPGSHVEAARAEQPERL